MSATVRLDVDLEIALDVAGRCEPFARITASGSQIDIEITRPMAVRVARRSALSWLTPLADAAAARGIVIVVTGPSGVVARAGAVRASLIHHRVTGSRHIQLGSPRALVALGGPRGASTWRLPPGTPLPLTPTLARARKDRATTTHYVPGSGKPRLIFTMGGIDWNGQAPREFLLSSANTTIGSDAAADLRLDGLGTVSAEIRHGAADEYLLHVVGEQQGVLLDPAESPSPRVLRTGARIDLGPWKLAFFREEFADHGRPYGGRLGGELARQRPQPARSSG